MDITQEATYKQGGGGPGGRLGPERVRSEELCDAGGWHGAGGSWVARAAAACAWGLMVLDAR